MVPSVSVLTDLLCLIESNICQSVKQTSCERRINNKRIEELTTKTVDVQELKCCQHSVDYIFCTLTYGGPQRQYTNIYYITAFYILVHKHIHWLCEYIYQYNKIYNNTTIFIPVQKYKCQNKNKSCGTKN